MNYLDYRIFFKKSKRNLYLLDFFWHFNRYYIINNSDNYNFYYRTYGDIIFYSKLKVNVITYENSILKINLKAIPVYSDDEVSSEIFVNIPNFKENVDKVIVDVNSDTAEEVYHGESRL